MLDRGKVLKELKALEHDLFKDTTQAYALARTLWERAAADMTLSYKIAAQRERLEMLVPTWEHNQRIDSALPVAYDKPLAYQAVSVDGSQIYPDRHQGIRCFLINIGTVCLSYGHQQPGAQLNSWPKVYTGDEHGLSSLSPDMVNGVRQEMELQAGVHLVDEDTGLSVDMPTVLLYDGSLIFWHLEAQSVQLREHFLPRYIHSLQQLQEKDVSVASYVSAPRSRELVNLLYYIAEDEQVGGKKNITESDDPLRLIVDATIAHFFLQPYTRSIVFKNHAAICSYYSEKVRPYFFYLHVGKEIGRVELPEWLAKDQERVDHIARVIVDQCDKGLGYPIALAEAHEQAVVKGSDRQFFYTLLDAMSIEQKRQLVPSQKSRRKRHACF